MSKEKETMTGIPFAPSVYEHAALLIGRSPWDVSRDEDLMVAGHRRAHEMYEHVPIVVGIDIYNLEAEAYGGTVTNPGGNGIPSVTNPPLGSLDAVPGLAPLDPGRDGRLPMIVRAARRLHEMFPEARVSAPVSGPVSICGSLVGQATLLIGMATDPDGTRRVLTHLVEGQVRFCRAVKEAGVRVALFESAAAPPLVGPRQFHTIVAPALNQLVRGASEVMGEAIPCIIGGDTEPILDDVLATGTRYVICPSETDRDKFMARLGERELTVRMNINPLTVSRGPVEKILAEVDEVLVFAERFPHITLGTGAVPYETPPEHILAIKRYVEEPCPRRL